MTRTIATIHSPANTADHRDRAPARTLSAVVLRDPPMGKPPNRPLAMFAAPWAMKSLESLRCAPSGLAMLWLTPAPCTAMTIDNARAPVTISNEKELSEGSRGIGIPKGISPTSRTTSTDGSHGNSIRSDGTRMATSVPKLPSRVHGNTIASRRVSAAAPTDGQCSSGRCMKMAMALRGLKSASPLHREVWRCPLL